MKNAALGNNWVIYTVSMKENTAEAVFPNQGNIISDARAYFTDLIENYVREEYRPQLLEILDIDRLEEIYSTKNDYELEFLLKEEIGGVWMRCGTELASRDEMGRPDSIDVIFKNIDRIKKRNLEEVRKIRQDNYMIEEVCQFAVESRYEEADLIDVENNSATAIARGNGGNDVGFLQDKDIPYDVEIQKLIDERAYSEDDRKKLSSMLLEQLVPILEKEGKHIIRVRLHTNNGDITWKQIETVFFRNDHNNIILLGSSAQKEEEIKESLRRAAMEAQEANRAKSAFLANMSHEIRTPMNAIVGISEILLNKELPDEILEKITTIQNAGNSLLGIINDILDFSRIETGKLEVHNTEYMLPSLLMDISNVITVRLSGQPVYFMMEIDPSLPARYIGDDIRLKQILINLLGNAVKFTNEGYIQLRVDGRPLDGDRYEIVFEVKDSGIGIRQQDIGKLFKTFSQVDTKRNRALSGSGLGLSISRDLARMMGGDLSVESVYGRGSTFTVKVVQDKLGEDIIGRVQNKNVRMLICEQNETIIFSLSRTMEKLGVNYEICREPERIRDYEDMTHVIVRRKVFDILREKLEFMFRRSNIFLVLENDEHATSSYMKYKQLQLPLISMQLINALNDETIVTSIKSKAFDRSQIMPLTFARVLLVDDNLTNLQVAQGLMAPYKMKIDVATSGFRAIEMVKSIRYHAIFMDHMMPEMDGIEATRYIRNLAGEYFKTVPIIALTANAMSEARAMFESAGMDDFVAKPIEMTELHRVLKKYVQSQAPEGYMEKELSKAAAGQGKKGHKGGRLLLADKADNIPARLGEAVNNSTNMINALSGADMMSRLLAQNNALLSQNILLLQALTGQTPQGMEDTGEEDEFGFDAPEDVGLMVNEEGQETPDDSAINSEGKKWEELHSSISGIDMTGTLEIYGGSVSIYHKILKTYYYDLKQREPELQRFLDSDDIDNFTISIHAVKSASYGVGAKDLGKLAEELEAAGKAGHRDLIGKMFPDFMAQLHFIIENVGYYVNSYLADEKNGVETVEGFSQEDIERLKHACEDMDYIGLEDMLREMNEKKYAEDAELDLLKMIGLCESFEYDELEKMIEDL